MSTPNNTLKEYYKTEFCRFIPKGIFDYCTNISLENNYIYFETAKVACSSIKKTLKYLEAQTLDIKILSEEFRVHKKDILLSPSSVGLEKFCEIVKDPAFFKFSFVRNPYSRVLSAYLDKIARESKEKKKFAQQFGLDFDKEITFENFLQCIKDQPPIEMNHHWRPQTNHLYWGLIDYQFLGRFENFDQDFEEILSKLYPNYNKRNSFINIKNHQPHKTKASNKIDHFYDRITRSLVAEIYKEDFCNFNYSVDLPINSNLDNSKTKVEHLKFSSISVALAENTLKANTALKDYSKEKQVIEQERKLDRGMKLKKYTIYANCQGQALAKVLNSCQSFSSQYEYIEINQVQNIGSSELNYLIEEVIPEVDLFIYQPISKKYNNNFKYSSTYMIEQLKKGCRSISFPSCYFRGYYPELKVIKNETNSNIDISFNVHGKYLAPILVHDINIIKGFIEKKSIEEIKNNFINNDFYDEIFLKKILAQTFLALESRENDFNIDIRISSFIKDNFRRKKLFHTFNHPTSALFEYIANCILKRLSIEPNFKNIPNTLDHASFPIYQSTYNKLQLNFENSKSHYFRGYFLKIEDVIKQYFKLYKTLPKENLKNYIVDWKPKITRHKNNDTEALKTYIQWGIKLKNEGKTTSATEKFSTVLSLNPNCIPALNQLGGIYEGRKEYKKAIAYYSHVIKLQPSNGTAYARLAKVMMAQKNIHGAITSYQKAIALQPDQRAWVYIGLGDCLQQNGQLNEAILVYQKALEIKPSNSKVQTQLTRAIESRELKNK